MTLYRLPPAGSRIPWADTVDESAVRGLFAPWEAAFFGSGTVALAALLLALRARFPERDEVIMAAYNCPSMISATRYAGCHAQLVDLAYGTPWMDLEAVDRALSPQTLAIVGVDLFGIPERHAALRDLAVGGGFAAIQDSAQAFPRRAGDAAWHGDAVILSFGRGKPVSLLGGGAVLCRDRPLARSVTQVAAESVEGGESNHRRQVRAYNLLRHPRLYWLPSSTPGSRLGETRYEPLTHLCTMPAWLKRRVPPAVAAYRARGNGVQMQYGMLKPGGGLVDLARRCGLSPDVLLSRYPLLARDRQERDHLCALLRNYGASPFYGSVLPEVTGLQELLGAADRFPAARDFAGRLFTLPTHDGVHARHVAAMGRLLCRPAIQPIKAMQEPAA